MRLVFKVVRWLFIAVLGISGLALMVAPALAQREMFAARSVDHSNLVGLPEAQTTTAASTGSQTSTDSMGSDAGLSRSAQPGRGSLPQPRVQDSGVGSVGDLLGLALLILGLAVALYSRPRPRIEYTPHQ